MLVNQLNKLFVYIPHGYGNEFITNHATTAEYAQKIVFVEDTKEIWTQGKGFGVSYLEFKSLLAKVNENRDRIVALEQGQASDVTDLLNKIDDINSSINTLNSSVNDLDSSVAQLFGDKDTEGSVEYAVDQLKQLILGSEDLIETLDTIKEIQEWIKDSSAGAIVESINDLNDKVDTLDSSLNALIDDLSDRLDVEIARSTDIDDDHEERIQTIEDINIWAIYESDSVPEGPDTVTTDTADDVNNIDNPGDTDVVVNTQDALSYFTDPAHINTTFQNITI